MFKFICNLFRDNKVKVKVIGIDEYKIYSYYTVQLQDGSRGILRQYPISYAKIGDEFTVYTSQISLVL